MPEEEANMVGKLILLLLAFYLTYKLLEIWGVKPREVYRRVREKLAGT